MLTFAKPTFCRQAMLLGFMPEKEAFWVLVGLMDGERFELERSAWDLGMAYFGVGLDVYAYSRM